MNWPMVPATMFHVRYTATRNTIDFTFTELVSARPIIWMKVSRLPSAADCFSVQSFDSSSLRCRFHAMSATTNRMRNNRRMANRPSKGP